MAILKYSHILDFQIMTPGSLVSGYQHFRVTYCLHTSILEIEAENVSEMLVPTYLHTLCHNPQDHIKNLHNQGNPEHTEVKSIMKVIFHFSANVS